MFNSVYRRVPGLVMLGLLLTACGSSSEESMPAPRQESPAAKGVISVVPPPPARVEVVNDTYHGVTVADPYRWLENWDDPDVRAWSEAHNAYARTILGRLPERPVVHARIRELLTTPQSVRYFRLRLTGANQLMAMKQDPSKQQDLLVLMNADGDPASEQPLVDPNEIDPSGSTSIDWYEPSWDGSMVAVSLSSGGSESGDLHLYRIPTGEPLDVVIPRVNAGTAGGDLAWLADDSGFYYTRYPLPGERPEEDELFYQKVWRHMLGTPVSEDLYMLGTYFPRIAEIRLMVDPDSDRLLVWVQNGDSNRFELYLRQPGGEWTRFARYDDGAIQAVFGPGDALYVISRDGAPRGRLLRLDASDPDLDEAVEIIPEGDGVMFHSFYYRHSPSLVVTDERIYQLFQVGGPTELRVFTFDGEPLAGPVQAPVSATDGLAPAGNSDLFFGSHSYVSPTNWYRFDSGDGTTTKLAISSESPVDYSDVEVVREFATSEDGTKVPVNILLPNGFAKDGTGAIVVTGYGGYGMSQEPWMSVSRHILFEHGVAFADANLRGGGEYGESWHAEGRLTNKQNVFDDFTAVIRYLIEEDYASPDRVAIVGGSNGGLLMGATLIQNPDLAAAVVSHVGIYDMLRVELDPNGQFNIPEFGTVKNAGQFQALYAYSPYHNVEEGTEYPPILMPTGANDPRVNPAHSRKFAARLRAAQDNGGVVLLRTSAGTGHGGGTPLDEVIELLTDQYTFLFHHLGVPVED